MSALQQNLPPPQARSQDRTNVQAGVFCSEAVARGVTILGNPPAVSVKAGPRATGAEQPVVWDAWGSFRVAPGSSRVIRPLEPGARGRPPPPPLRGACSGTCAEHRGTLGGFIGGFRICPRGFTGGARGGSTGGSLGGPAGGFRWPGGYVRPWISEKFSALLGWPPWISRKSGADTPADTPPDTPADTPADIGLRTTGGRRW